MRAGSAQSYTGDSAGLGQTPARVEFGPAGEASIGVRQPIRISWEKS
jgi:hypothetical protein